jgi:hypothetical protein
MATLLVSAAVNIAVGLVINELFPPPDVNQEGPRLTELGYTSAAYGSFVNIIFGTDRVAGNLIDTTDPAIEEVVTTESQSAKGGGQTVNTTTYTYFLTGRVSWGIEGASAMIRWWGDGKIILDATGTGQIVKEGVTHTFYPGGPTQLQDPEEVSRRGSDIPAYRHLTTSKIDRMPLADFGNRIPNFTAEIAFDSTQTNPFIQLTPEPSGFNPPGSFAGGDTTYMSFNPERNELYGLKGGTLGTWSANGTDLTFKSGIGGGAEGAIGLDGFGYSNNTGANSTPLNKHDVETGVIVASLGTQGADVNDSSTGPRYGSVGFWTHLRATQPGVGNRGFTFHLNGLSARNGSVTATEGGLVYMHTISSADGTLPDNGPNNRLAQLCAVVPDHVRGVAYLLAPNAQPTATSYSIIKYTPVSSVGVGGAVDTDILVEVIKTFTVGVDINGTGDIKGWAVNNANGDLMWSNGTETMLYNPITDTILGTLTTGASSFQGRNNYYSGAVFAWASSHILGEGKIYVVNTLDMTSNSIIDTVDIGWPTTGNPAQDTVIHVPSVVWDDRSQAIFLSRQEASSDAPNGARILKIFINRVNALGVGLDTVVAALSTTYQRQKMAGLLASDIDVTTLAADTVQGYTLTRKSTMKSALEPLRTRWDFDGVQSDWIMKFPKRGGGAVLTIPEEDVGELKRGRDQTDTPAVQEMRQDDLTLPMRLGVRFRNKDTDYQVDFEHDKRHLSPNPHMSSKNELTLDVPIVEQSQAMKRLAQQKLWTAWNERITYKTVVPWTYIKLDATDVFNMGVFGETHQLRMGEQDLGVGWSIEVVGVVEDTKQYSSTLAAGSAAGHIGQTVPSSLPTRLIPFDAPLLSLEDLRVDSQSNAYMVVSAFEDSWPGASVMKSLDDVSYNVTGTVNTEAAIAAVRTAPGAWNIVNGDFPNRWQEVADGGSIVLTTLRRPDVWASAASELGPLGFSNTIGVIRDSDKQVEIISFETAVVNADLTVTLSRLLRGRLGTEDIADLGITAGDRVVLLSNETGVKESAPIITQSLTLSELDTPLFFKGVTIGTLVEDATLVSHTYTGRDLKPYMPAQLSAVSDGSGGLDVSWERRTRGPLAAEWLDGTGETVLNEQIEQYEVTLSNLGGDFITKVVNDARTVNFSLADIELGGAPGGISKQFWPITDFGAGSDIVSGDQEGGTVESNDQPLIQGNWVNINSPTGWRYKTGANGSISGPPSHAVITPASSTYLAYQANTSDSLREIRNRIQFVRDLGMNSNDIPLSTVRLSMWFATGREDDEGRIRLDVENDAGGSLAAVAYNNIQANIGSDGVNIGDWIHVGSLYDQATVPGNTNRPIELSMAGAGAFQLGLRLAIEKAGTTLSTGRTGYDHIEIEILTPPSDITAKVVMVSDTGLKSPIAIRQVT